MAYTGGKSQAGVFQWIINNQPPHVFYCEPFAGGLGVGKNKRPARFNFGIDLDPGCIQDLQALSLPGWSFVCGDGLDWLKHAGVMRDWLIYVDPPYLFRTRLTKGNLYRFDMGEVEQHREMLLFLRSLPCMVMISGYADELYSEILDGWRVGGRVVYDRGHNPKLEQLWMNFEEPTALHDYRFLGENRRKRQDFRRLQSRWVQRLANMPRLHRLALSAALDGVDADAAGVVDGEDITAEDEAPFFQFEHY